MRRRETAAHKLNQLILSAIHVNNEEVQQGLQNRVAIEEDAKKRQQLKDNPDIFREELRQRKMSLVFQDWLAQINRNLRVELLSETLKARLSGK